MENFLPEVRQQYETLPFPHRRPEDERERLLTTWLDSLFMINHYCFAGRRDFTRGFRVLVAGGGTGDGTIYLAEQLKTCAAEVVHCDMSSASIAVAQQRAEIRGLKNIRWINDSLLNLPGLDVGRFDYINCSGVLHHLADPDAGLRALASVLAPEGAIGLMLYGTYGRTGIEQMRKLLALVNTGNSDAYSKLECAKQMIEAVPRTNWFIRGNQQDQLQYGDAGTYDLLLHSQERSYTVEELYAWLEDEHGFHLEFSDTGRGKAPYMPHLLVAPRKPEFLEKVRPRPVREQQGIAELMGGTLDMHSLYLTRGVRVAPYGDGAYIPFFCHEPVTGPQISAMIHRSKDQPFVINHAHTGITAPVDQGRYGKFVLQYLDGKRTFAEIFALVRQEGKVKHQPPSDEALFEDFKPLYTFFNAIERMLLKHA